ncbi:hypothetical protein CY34DRAFT_155886 [Suillus luteus UH-Slu-Lm8-n1]|uniref:Uncharacterized protein n=1 Tax=Suillus luteus UH-Slu-Lm8-n1 TaxID=930992 RepID=A0A0D0BGA3_9AGAM|nr:hypothetical protein CY34DRAFT_155886 [Suillus luteus UH-Slu-Lm8-n1]
MNLESGRINNVRLLASSRSALDPLLVLCVVLSATHWRRIELEARRFVPDLSRIIETTSLNYTLSQCLLACPDSGPGSDTAWNMLNPGVERSLNLAPEALDASCFNVLGTEGKVNGTQKHQQRKSRRPFRCSPSLQ